MKAAQVRILGATNKGARDARVSVLGALAVLALAFVGVARVGAQSGGYDAELNRALAGDLVVEARRAAVGGDTEAARDIAERALAIDPEFGPALYLLATFLADDQRSTLYHIELLEAALQRELSDADRSAAVQLLARSYLRIGRAERARRILEDDILRGPPDNLVVQWRDLSNREWYPEREGRRYVRQPSEEEILFARTVAVGTPTRRGASFLRTLRMRYPDNPAIAEIDWMRHDALTLEVLEWLDTVTANGEAAGDPIVRAVGRLVTAAPPSMLRRELAYTYYRLGGDDALPFALVAGDAGVDRDDPVWARALGIVNEAQSCGDKGVVELLAESEADPEIVSEERLLALDDDRDGFWEELYRYTSEGLDTWIRDADENGVGEIALTIGTPGVAVWYRTDMMIYGYRYRRYPRVDTVVRISVREIPGKLGPASREELSSVDVWRPPEPVDLAQPVWIRPPDDRPIGLERGFRTYGENGAWITVADRLDVEGRPDRSFERQLDAAGRGAMTDETERDELNEELRDLCLIR